MKTLFATLVLFAGVISNAQASSCYGPRLARDTVRAIALVSDRSMISDIVGGSLPSESTGDEAYQIWANYRAFNYSDHYEVRVNSDECRVLSVQLVAHNQPVREVSP